MCLSPLSSIWCILGSRNYLGKQWICVAVINTLPRWWFIEVPPAPNYVNPIICWGGFTGTACSCNTLFLSETGKFSWMWLWVLSVMLPQPIQPSHLHVALEGGFGLFNDNTFISSPLLTDWGWQRACTVTASELMLSQWQTLMTRCWEGSA